MTACLSSRHVAGIHVTLDGSWVYSSYDDTAPGLARRCDVHDVRLMHRVNAEAAHRELDDDAGPNKVFSSMRVTAS